jgi:hypothetical protein
LPLKSIAAILLEDRLRRLLSPWQYPSGDFVPEGTMEDLAWSEESGNVTFIERSNEGFDCVM